MELRAGPDLVAPAPTIGRFIQPDSIVPSYVNPQNWNRYSYVINSPISHRDPTGHTEACGAYTEDCEDDPIMPNGNGSNGGLLVSIGTPGPACTATVPACVTNSANTLSYLAGGSTAVAAAVASTRISATLTNDGLIIIYGPRVARGVAGINPYTNVISPTNGANLSRVSTGISSAVSSPFTWAGIGISIYADYTLAQNGDYTDNQFFAAATVGIANGLVAAAVSGAIVGAVTGTLVTASVTAGLGAFPGFVAGALLGATVEALAYMAVNQLKPALVEIISRGIDAYSDAITNNINNGIPAPIFPGHVP